MSAVVRLRDLDPHSWVIASWLAPLVAPLLVDVLLVTFWLLGKWPLLDRHEFALFVTAVILDVVVLMAVALLMLKSHSPPVQGWSICIAGTSAIIFIGGLAFAIVIIKGLPFLY